jgi:aminoglycoside 6'-N-acetyltransferase
VLQGRSVVLRPALSEDLPRFLDILRSPEVALWWGNPPAADELDDEFLGPEVTTFAVVIDGAVAGLIQYHEENEPDYRSAGVDIALAPECHGRGFGADAVETLARHLFESRGHHRLTMDPAAANQRAIACYLRAGFKPVGVMRQYERGADGTWHDGLLMELLRDEFS